MTGDPDTVREPTNLSPSPSSNKPGRPGFSTLGLAAAALLVWVVFKPLVVGWYTTDPADEKALGPSHPSTARSCNDVGRALQLQGKNEEALAYFQRALTIHEKVLGESHPSTATDLNNIGASYHAQGKYSEASKYSQRARSR